MVALKSSVDTAALEVLNAVQSMLWAKQISFDEALVPPEHQTRVCSLQARQTTPVFS